MSDKPEKPSEQDCCGSGCNPCILDVYEQKLRQWESHRTAQNTCLLNYVKYSPFMLIKLEQILLNTYLFTFKAVNDENEPLSGGLNLQMGDYLILRKEDISRPYTPILNNNYLNDASFQTIIKLYDEGKMSQHLRKATVGNIFLWRGPYSHFNFQHTKYILLIGAGTGIVPLYNIAKELVNNEQIETFIKMFVCVTDLSSVFLRKEINDLADFWNFTFQFFLSHSEAVDVGFKERATFRKLSFDDIKQQLSHCNGSINVVICGPNSFNDFCKKTVIACGVNETNITVM